MTLTLALRPTLALTAFPRAGELVIVEVVAAIVIVGVPARCAIRAAAVDRADRFMGAVLAEPCE